MIDTADEQLRIIEEILQKHVADCEVRAFGSRCRGTARNYSDLDLAIVGDTRLDWRLIENIKEAFSESDLPFRVDVLDWYAISPEFRGVIEAGYEVIQSRHKGTK
ncbi:nucleotidyltransferase domain-containing protein [bacterium]|nr:nucleotidyltransferase domain-containing protein [bacterium]MBU1752492.1 nucleotidyltransferase domain-containing protein [bacterium]